MTAVAAPTTVAPHPAKFSPTILDRLGVLLAMEAQGRGVDRLRVLDPFGGTGRVHLLGHDSVSSELEPESPSPGTSSAARVANTPGSFMAESAFRRTTNA